MTTNNRKKKIEEGAKDFAARFEVVMKELAEEETNNKETVKLENGDEYLGECCHCWSMAKMYTDGTCAKCGKDRTKLTEMKTKEKIFLVDPEFITKLQKEVEDILENNTDETLWGDDDSNEIMKISISNYKSVVKADLYALLDKYKS